LGGGQRCFVSGQQNAYFILKKNDLTILEIRSIITGCSMNYCNFLKFITYVRGGHCDLLALGTKNLATPLECGIISM
jgi:hypothetical protein